MRPKIRCDGKSTVLLQNFLDLNWAWVALALHILFGCPIIEKKSGALLPG
jgi:hypothetical protein